MSDPTATNQDGVASRPDTGGGAPAAEPLPARAEGPSTFVQVVAAVALGLLAVVAAQSFFISNDMNRSAQSLSALTARVLADSDRSAKMAEEIAVLRGQVGELRNVLQIARGQSGAGAAADAPPGPRDWTGVHVNELAPLLPVLAQYEGEMGEAWIYTDNEDFIESIARALEGLEQGGGADGASQAQ